MPKDSHAEFWEDKGKYKPLSVWKTKGYDTDMLLANCLPRDRRPDPVFGEVFRVRVYEDGVKHSKGYSQKHDLNCTRMIQPPEPPQLAIADGRARDSSSSSSSTSSSSRKHKKSKKSKKHKKDKKDKKDKKSKKEKKLPKRSAPQDDLKSNMSAQPLRHSRKYIQATRSL